MKQAGADAMAFEEIRSGSLGVRLATHRSELEAAQSLRYQIFYREMGARADAETAFLQSDRDAYDAVADHLLVIDHTLGDGPDGVVGTYRLIRREAAQRLGHFYSAGEYDIARLEANGGSVLELGRSCVAAAYRGRAVMQLLWRGIASYVAQHGIDLMFGCASLPGTDPAALATELTYLYYHHLAPPAIRPRALPDRYIDMRRLELDAIDAKAAIGLLPPLIKGYLRLGGFVGDGAVIDAQFNTTDIAVVVLTDLITEKYHKHYERHSREALD
jgi:L-ornithine Nalpha-acyltransferase